MANLIITIISIALVAVAALMGAYYGGVAFLEGQIKAKANRLISDAEQIAAAYRLYSVNRGGSFAPPTDDTFNYLVSQGYLASLPKPDMDLSVGGQDYRCGIGSYDIPASGSGCDPSDTPAQVPVFVYLMIADNGSNSAPRVCSKIAEMARGPSALVDGPLGDNSYPLGSSRLQIDCGLTTDNSSDYYFAYRVF